MNLLYFKIRFILLNSIQSFSSRLNSFDVSQVSSTLLDLLETQEARRVSDVLYVSLNGNFKVESEKRIVIIKKG